jgi:hypothetical protein
MNEINTIKYENILIYKESFGFWGPEVKQSFDKNRKMLAVTQNP